MLVRAKFELKQSRNHQNQRDYFYVVTVFTKKLDTLSLVHHFHLNQPKAKLLHGHIKIIFLVAVKILFLF